MVEARGSTANTDMEREKMMARIESIAMIFRIPFFMFVTIPFCRAGWIRQE